MRRKAVWLLKFIIVYFLGNICHAQDGIPFISNYSIHQQTQSIIWSIEESENGMFYFANREGVFTFDGSNWEFINIPSLPLSLKHFDDKLFVGSRNNFGEIIIADNGNYEYQSIISEPDSLNLGDITSIIGLGNLVIITSEISITILQKEDYSISNQFYSSPGFGFSDLLLLNDNVYVSQFGKGIFQVTEDSLEFVINNSVFTENELLFSLQFNPGKLLLGFDDGSLHSFNGKEVEEYKIEDFEYLDESILGGGINISEDLFALSTLSGGALIVEKRTGKSRFIMNFQTGLPDDEIFAIGMDKNGGLWLSHEYGISRVDFAYPVRNFSFYPGLKGNLNDVIEFNNTVYVASSDGVYYLTEIKDYQEKEITVKVKKKTKPKPKPAPVPQPVVQEEEEIDISKLTKKEQRKLKWQNRKDKLLKSVEKSDVDEAKEIEEKYGKPDQAVKRDEYRYVKKKIYSLLSISHGYKKIEGLDIKCKDLIIANEKLLVSTNSGLYEIKNEEFISVIDNVYIHDAFPYKNSVYIGTSKGIVKANYKEENWIIEKINEDIYDNIYSVVVTNDDMLYAGSDNLIYKVDLKQSGYQGDKYLFKSKFSLKVIARKVNEVPLFFTQSGVFMLENDSLVLSGNPLFENASEYIFSQNDRVWLKTKNTWYGLPESKIQLEINPVLLNLVQNIESIFTLNGDVIWAINVNNAIYRIEGEVVKSKKFDVFFKCVEDQEGERFRFDLLKVDYTNSALKFIISAPYYINPESTQYQYYIKGLMNDWSKWSNSMEIDFPFIPPGNYDISIRARNILGSKSDIKSLNFIVKSPYWTAWWFYLLVIAAFVIVVYIVFQLRLKKLRKDKRILEQKVKERTAEIQRQKDEIQDQKDEIEAQRDTVTAQMVEILKQKEDITASIMYAQRIQNAVLPPESIIEDNISDHFIFFKPRDIVSGDFYWMKQINGLTIITAADCTGHGVPGAFMSMLGMTLLNEIVRKKDITQANHVLDELRNEIKNSLRQTGKEGEAKDGMDLALCVIDHKSKTMQYAGAYNPLYLYRNNELMEIKADRMPIGIYVKDTNEFTNHEIKLKKGDTFYLFSDGYVDQFGGEKGMKFKTRAFKQLLLEIHQKPMQDQKETLENTFTRWKGKHEQIDDVLIIGIKM